MNKSTEHMSNKNLMGIVLAGGEGVRLQKFVTGVYGFPRPKQYCAFTGTRTMFKHTIDRISLLIPQKNIVAVVNSSHKEFVDAERKSSPGISIIEQPCMKDTAAGILFPLLKIKQKSPDATVAIFPSDHFVANELKFMEYVEQAVLFAEENPKLMVTIGIQMQKTEPGFGWIRTSKELFTDGVTRIHGIDKFVEKPDLKLLQSMRSEELLVNTSVLIGKCSAFIRHINRCVPELLGAFEPIRAKFETTFEEITIRRFYKYLPEFNFSRDVLQKNPAYLKVIKAEGVEWNDWGMEERVTNDIMNLNPAFKDSFLTIH